MQDVFFASKADFLNFYRGETTESQYKSAHDFFKNSVSFAEAKFSKDFYDMDADEELLQVFTSPKNGRLCSYNQYLKMSWILRHYLTWCKDTGVISSGKLLSHRLYSSSLLQQYKMLAEDGGQKYFSSRQELVDYFNELLQQEDGENPNADMTIRCVFFLAWMGFSIEEASKLLLRDYDGEKHTIAGREIPHEFQKSLILYSKIEGVYVNNRGKMAFKEFKNSNYFIRNSYTTKTITNSTVTGYALKLNRLAQSTGSPVISYKSIQQNGMFDSFYALESEYAEENPFQLFRRTFPKLTADSYARNLYQQYLIWKEKHRE